MATNKYEPVNAGPVKSFFIEMLTRDIELVDAILDLLDNCVDGILRTEGNSLDEKPYDGFNAKIMFDENSSLFLITVVAFPGIFTITRSEWVKSLRIETLICQRSVFTESV